MRGSSSRRGARRAASKELRTSRQSLPTWSRCSTASSKRCARSWKAWVARLEETSTRSDAPPVICAASSLRSRRECPGGLSSRSWATAGETPSSRTRAERNGRMGLIWPPANLYGLVCRRDSSECMTAKETLPTGSIFPLLAGDDQHLDSPILGERGVTERARLDPGSRHSGVDQRGTNGLDPTIAHLLIARGGAARIHRAVDPDLEGRILPHVSRDFGNLGGVRSLNVGSAIREREVPVGGPAVDDAGRALPAHRSHPALNTRGAGGANCAGGSGHGPALSARVAGHALRAGDTGVTRRSGRTDQCGALTARLSDSTLCARGTGTPARKA